jgi:predicted nuclease of predicted toxin-antitoxin system
VKFLLDHCVPNLIGTSLTQAGHDCIRLRECLPTDSPDADVLRKARELNAELILLNGDFADITSYPPSQHHGIVALQVRNHPQAMPPIIARLLSYLGRLSSRREMDGKLLIVEPHRIRVRT